MKEEQKACNFRTSFLDLGLMKLQSLAPSGQLYKEQEAEAFPIVDGFSCLS